MISLAWLTSSSRLAFLPAQAVQNSASDELLFNTQLRKLWEKTKSSRVVYSSFGIFRGYFPEAAKDILKEIDNIRLAESHDVGDVRGVGIPMEPEIQDLLLAAGKPGNHLMYLPGRVKLERRLTPPPARLSHPPD